ncbi:MAG: GntR family transcriptional regulator [Pirellulales bacterium]|nr:GntR family transcriptional regulator [Pirellulales bacterium]
MLLRIEKGSAVPISRQLAAQIEALVSTGNLAPGAKLPSVRELARELAVNQNTVLRVYERLAREGLLDMRQGQGTFVTARPRGPAMKGRREKIAEELRQVARQGVALGLTAEQLHELLAEVLAEPATMNHRTQVAQHVAENAP